MEHVVSIFDGTLPLLPFDQHAQDFFGSVSGASGTPPQVLALVAEADGTLVYLNVVGYQTACSAHFARLWQGEPLSFQAAPGLGVRAPSILTRSKDWSYQEIGGPLKDTPYVNAMGLTRQANIGYGMKVPPVFPAQRATAKVLADDDDGDDVTPAPVSTVNLKGALPRFVFGNAHETTPAVSGFHGHLRALRVVRLDDTRSPAHTRCTEIWLEQLWLHGLTEQLIVPLVAHGIRAWRICGDLLAWADLVQRGLAAGWLPRP
jgi:hypothetical protein